MGTPKRTLYIFSPASDSQTHSSILELIRLIKPSSHEASLGEGIQFYSQNPEEPGTHQVLHKYLLTRFGYIVRAGHSAFQERHCKPILEGLWGPGKGRGSLVTSGIITRVSVYTPGLHIPSPKDPEAGAAKLSSSSGLSTQPQTDVRAPRVQQNLSNHVFRA